MTTDLIHLSQGADWRRYCDNKPTGIPDGIDPRFVAGSAWRHEPMCIECVHIFAHIVSALPVGSSYVWTLAETRFDADGMDEVELTPIGTFATQALAETARDAWKRSHGAGDAVLLGGHSFLDDGHGICRRCNRSINTNRSKVVACHNCALDLRDGGCPRCYQETGNGCPHGKVCGECVEFRIRQRLSQRQKDRSDLCPSCGRDLYEMIPGGEGCCVEPTYSAVEVNGAVAYQSGQCPHCEARWTDEYAISRVVLS